MLSSFRCIKILASLILYVTNSFTMSFWLPPLIVICMYEDKYVHLAAKGLIHSLMHERIRFCCPALISLSLERIFNHRSTYHGLYDTGEYCRQNTQSWLCMEKYRNHI